MGGDGTRRAILLRRRRWRGDLPRDRVAVLRAGRRGRNSAPGLPRRRPGGRRGTAADVPRAVLGWPANLLRAAWPSPVADAARPVSDRPVRARRLAAVHA